MSGTPRTDKKLESCADFDYRKEAHELASFARELELENARLEHFLAGEKIARQYAIDKVVKLQRHNFLLMQSGKALRHALAFECKKLGYVPREIEEWDALVKAGYSL